MYAIAVHDPASGRLLLARDPFGIKPLYYTRDGRLFAFASEPQALLAAGLGARARSIRCAGPNCCSSSSPPGAATIFPGIFRLLPGETLVVERGRARRGAAAASALPAGPPRAGRGGGGAA